tara:strand:- start:7728 stop:9452 length:1725 start_codon:yes stop_codon:yes gene_type:complete
MGGGNSDNPMDSLEVTSATKKDPLTAGRETQLWQQAQKFAAQSPFQAQYGGMTPGFTPMQQQAQNYLGTAILGDQYSAENLGFTNYARPSGVGAAPSWSWQNSGAGDFIGDGTETDPTLGPTNPTVPPPPPPGGPTPIPDPADPPAIGYVPSPDPVIPSPPPTTVKPSPGDVNLGMGGAAKSSVEYPVGLSMDEYLSRPSTTPAAKQAQIAQFGYAKAPAGPDFMPQPMPQPSPDIMPQPVGPSMPETPPDIAPPPPGIPAPPGGGYLGPGDVFSAQGVGMNEMDQGALATKRMLQEEGIEKAVAGSIFDDPKSIDQYMNKLGTDAAVADITQDYERLKNQAMAKQAGARSFGSRKSVEDAGLAGDYLRTVAMAKGAGYDRAAARMDDAAKARTSANLANLQAQQAFRAQQIGAADQLSGLGKRRQDATFNAAQQLADAGREQQMTQLQQQAFDYEQWLRGQQGGADELSFMKSMIPGGDQFTYGQKPDRLSQLIGLGVTGASFLSDAKAKENIRSVGTKNGLNIYEFNYLGQPTRWRGVIAQEVMKTRPDAVRERNGVLSVNYDALGIAMELV